MNSPLAYIGGKSRLSKAIVKMIPEHRSYCEVFAGGGWVFFRAEELVAFLNPISTENKEEEKIQTKMRIMAIEALKAEGELPLDFEA